MNANGDGGMAACGGPSKVGLLLKTAGVLIFLYSVRRGAAMAIGTGMR